MEHKYSILLILAVVLLMPFIVAQPTYEQGTNVTLRIPCTINGVFCDESADCDATLINPDGIALYNKEIMVQNGSVFELDLSKIDTFIKGEYELTVACVQGSKETTKTLYFYITATSKKYGNSLFSFDFSDAIYLIITGILVLISVIAFIYGVYILSGSLLSLLGLIFLFSRVSMLISALFIVIGIVIIFHKS